MVNVLISLICPNTRVQLSDINGSIPRPSRVRWRWRRDKASGQYSFIRPVLCFVHCYATICTGCLFVSEYCTSWAPLFTSVFMGQLHLIWRIYVSKSLPILVVIFAQQHMETCWCLGREQWPMDHEVLLLLVLLSIIDRTCIDHYTWTV